MLAKVMFSQVSVCPRGGGVSASDPGVCGRHPAVAVGKHPPPGRHPPADGQQAGGTHPTGMHYCLNLPLVWTITSLPKPEYLWKD